MAVVAAVVAVAALAWGAAPAAAVGPPAPSFTFSPSSPVTGQQVRFDATGTTEANPPGPNPRRYDWDFNGDGTFDADGAVVSTSFSVPGTYPVQLRVTGTDGISQSVTSRNVVVRANTPARAGFYTIPLSPAVNQIFQLTSTAFDSDGRVASQSWDLDGDGAFDDGSGQVAFMLFTSPGRRLIRLLVVDDSGATSVANRIVNIIEPLGTSLPLMNPFPVVRLAGSLTRLGARVRVLSVLAPRGSRIVVQCRSRKCPHRRASTRARSSDRAVRIRRFQRKLQAGVVLEVIVTREGQIGKHTRFRIRRGRSPKRSDGCVLPGTTRRIDCP